MRARRVQLTARSTDVDGHDSLLSASRTAEQRDLHVALLVVSENVAEDVCKIDCACVRMIEAYQQ